jgi:hypothetical protein
MLRRFREIEDEIQGDKFMTPEQSFQSWKSARSDYALRYSSAEVDARVLEKAQELQKEAGHMILAAPHFDRAVSALQLRVIPVPAVRLTPDFIVWIQSRSRAQLVAEILESGERSELARKYAKACREHGFQPVFFPVAQVSAQELYDFEQITKKMSTMEQKQRYAGLLGEGTGKGSFKWWSDLLEQQKLYEQEKPLELTIEAFNQMSKFDINKRYAADERFRAAVDLLKSRGQIA